MYDSDEVMSGEPELSAGDDDGARVGEESIPSIPLYLWVVPRSTHYVARVLYAPITRC